MRRRWLAAALWVALASGCGARPGSAPEAPALRPVCPGARVTVDRQAEELAGCVEIDGDLRIYGPALSTVSPLRSVTAIRGDLIIGPTASLRTLTGLDGLRSVDGDVRIEETLRLASASLPGLVDVGGSVRVENNRDLALVGLPVLERVGQHLFVTDNPVLIETELGPDARIAGERFIQTEQPDADEEIEIDLDSEPSAGP